MAAPAWRISTSTLFGVAVLSVLLTTCTGARAATGASSGDPPDAAQPAADTADTADSGESEREAILRRLRDARTPVGEHQVTPGEDEDAAVAEFPRLVVTGMPAVTDTTIELMLQALAAQRDAQEAERARLAARSELTFFGVTDHFRDPHWAYYQDPVQSVQRAPMLMIDQVDPGDFDYPIVVTDRVEDWMVYFLTRGRKHYTKWLGRKQRYEPFISEQLAAAGMPQDLIYQSMIESGFSPYAYSWAKAAGIWQFIPSTGRRYHMQIDWWVDQRRDPYIATGGAIGYLEYLYGLFGDWQLASSAYNAGEGKIGRAISRYDTRNFFELCQGDYLKPETKDYVPKIIAAAILGHYPDRYGLTEEVPEWFEPWEFETVTVPEATDMGIVAEITGTTEEALLEMNPSLRRWCTPPGAESFDIRVPVGAADGFHEALAAVPEDQRLTFKRYKVARGDTLGVIAGRYGVSVSSIMELNTIRNPNRISVGQYLVIPLRGTSTRTRDLLHTVERGETLARLAARYGASVSQLREWNDLSGSTIYIGQHLTVQQGKQPEAEADTGTAIAEASTEPKAEATTEPTPDEGDAVADAATDEATKQAPVATAEPEPVQVAEATAEPPKKEKKKRQQRRKKRGEDLVHKVISGDTLGALAGHYDVSVTDLMGWNSLANHLIYVGQKLTVYPGPESATRRVTHKVRRGDTLWEIARAHSVSVAQLQEWNGMGGGSTIRTGQKLTIYSNSGSASTSRTRNRTVTHQVERGETLWEIARRYEVSVDALKKWNRLSRDTVYIGQTLTVKLR